jgi:ParB-like chromosome segregation protein Spo0J
MACANGEMLFHEAANILPLDDDNIISLADDIRANGQQVAIELLDGKVLDGRRRWLACKMAGKKPVTRNVDVADPIAYVLSLNLHRRHLSPTQLSVVGARARLAKWLVTMLGLRAVRRRRARR